MELHDIPLVYVPLVAALVSTYFRVVTPPQNNRWYSKDRLRLSVNGKSASLTQRIPPTLT